MNKSKLASIPLRIMLIYAVVTGASILLGDFSGSQLTLDQPGFVLWDLLKDILFVAVTAGLVYELVRRNFQAIIEIETHYRNLIESASDVVYTLDLDGRFTSINQAVEPLLGYTPQELLGHRLVEFAPAAAGLLQQMRDAKLQDGARPRYELALPARTGHLVILEINSQLLVKQGRPIGLHGVARDITARKHIESQLQASEAQLRALFTAMTDIILVLDDTGRYLQIAPTNPQQLYRPTEELLGRTLHDVFEPAQAAEFLAAIHRALATRQTVILEYTLTLHDRATRFAATLSPLNERAVVWVVRDITARKQAEAALEHERDVLRALLDNTVDTIYFKDTASRFTRINRAQADVLGLADPQQAIGQTDADFFPPELAAQMLAEERQILETGQPALSHEEYNPTRDGQPRWFSTSKNPLIDQAGQIVGLVGISRDITAVKLREREFEVLSIQNAQLLAAEREQRTLAEALRDIATALNSTLNFDEVLDRVLANIERVVPHDTANIMLINAEDGQAVARVARCHGYDRISPELDSAVRQLRFPVMAVANLRQMLETGQPFIIGDIHTYPAWLDSPPTHWQHSYVGAPIHLRDSVVGFIQLDSRQVDFFTPAAAERLQTFANQAAVAIENAQLFQAEREQRTLAEALRDTAAALNSTLNFDEVLDRILSNVGRIVSNDVATLLLIEHGVARVIRAVGYADPEHEARVRHLRFSIAQTPSLQRVVATQQPGLIANTATDPAWTTVAGIDWIKSNIIAPMMIKGQVIGMLALDSGLPNFYTPLHAERLQAFAAQAAVAMENVRLLEETQQGLKEQSALLAASTAVSSSLDLPTVLQRLAEQMGRAIDATSVYVCEWNQAANTSTVMIECYGPGASELERQSDLGVVYDLATDYGPNLIWQQPGSSLVIQVDDPDVPPERAAHLRQHGCWSVLTVGLIAKSNIFGYIELWETRQRRDFAPAEMALCQAIAQQAALAFENARLFDAERKQLRLAQTLQAVGALLTAQMSLDEVFECVFDLLARVIAYDSVSVQLLENDQLAVIAGRGFPDAAVMREIVSQVSRPTLEERWGAPHRQVMTLPDTHADPRWIIYPGSEYIRSWIGAVLRVKGRLLGILNVDSRTPRAYTVEMEDTLVAFANQAAIAIENAQLNEAVRRHADELEERVMARTTELEHERKRTAAILDTAGEGIVFTDVHGTLEYVNQAMERISGYPSTDALGQNPRLWQSGKTSPALYHELWDTIKRDRIWQGELVNRRKDGGLYDAALTIAPLHDAEGRIAGFVGVERDITQRKELERLKDEFVSNVSHELRTPIANVKLYISLLTRGKPEKRDEYVQTLKREAGRLENLIEDLLDLSRLDLETGKVELAPTDLKPLTAQLIADRSALAASRGHTIDYQTDERPVMALADPAALGQVFTNLLTNAVNYTPPGGLISVTVAPRELDGQPWATFTVKDSGPGISAVDLPRLFDRFYRGAVGRKSGAPGTGLGLAISDKIIDRLGGQITVDSQEGRGAAFTVWLKTA